MSDQATITARTNKPVWLATWKRRSVGGAAVLALHAVVLLPVLLGSDAVVSASTPAPHKEITAILIRPMTPSPPAPTEPEPRKTVAVVRHATTAPAPRAMPVAQVPLPTALSAPAQAEPQPLMPTTVPVAAAEPAPSAPAQSSAPPQPQTISSGVEYLRPPQPEYPASARRRGEQGVVVLRVLINDKGAAEHVDIQTSSGFASMDEAGRKAVLRALFKPYIDRGKPTAVYALIPINFQLDF